MSRLVTVLLVAALSCSYDYLILVTLVSCYTIGVTLVNVWVLNCPGGWKSPGSKLRRALEADVRNNRTLAVFIVVAIATMAAGLRAQSRDDSVPVKPPTVLFMCPHGAAKSVLASAYFEQLAKERGLNVRVES